MDKKEIAIYVFVFTFICIAIVDAAVDQGDIMAYYELDNENDSAGQNHASSSDALFWSSDCIYGSCAVFTGASGAGGQSMNFSSPLLYENFTYMLWFWDNTSLTNANAMSVFSNQNDSALGGCMLTYISSGNKYKAQCGNGTNWYGVEQTSWTTDAWTHIALVKNTTDLAVYWNGTFLGAATVNSIVASANNLIIGKSAMNFARDFGGMVDQFMIINRSLTTAEVQDDYNSGIGRSYIYYVPPIVTTPQIENVTNTTTLNTSTFIEWDTDISSNASVNYGTTLNLGSFIYNATSGTSHSNYLSGLTHNTTYFYNVTSCESTDGNCNTTGSYNFTTTESTIPQYPQIENVTNTTTTNESSFITWNTNIASNATVEYGTTFNLGTFIYNATSGTSHNNYLSGLTHNTTYFYNVTSCTSEDWCNTTSSHNFTTTLNEKSISIKLINPLTDTTFTQYAWSNFTIELSCIDTGVDCGNINLSLDPFSKGQTGLINYFQMNTTNFDLKNSSTSVLSNDATLIDGKFDKAYNFTDVGDRINLNTPVYTDTYGQENFTFNVWVNRRAEGGDHSDHIFRQSFQGGEGTEYHGIALGKDSTNDGLIRFIRGNGTYWSRTTFDMTDYFNQWIMISGRVQKVNDSWFNQSLYLNGVLVNSTPRISELAEGINAGRTLFDSPANMTIGAQADNSRYWVGEIDDAQFWEIALSDAEILELYQENTTYADMQGAQNKSLISMTPGAVPFYTNDTNSRLVSLNSGESANYTWHINTTGNATDAYTFFAFANVTSDMTISSQTSNVEITIEGAYNFNFVQTPYNFSVDNTTAFAIQYNITNTTTLDTFYINDTSNFAINGTGYFQNATNLNVSNYTVTISANDTSNNIISQLINVEITNGEIVEDPPAEEEETPSGGGGGGSSYVPPIVTTPPLIEEDIEEDQTFIDSAIDFADNIIDETFGFFGIETQKNNNSIGQNQTIKEQENINESAKDAKTLNTIFSIVFIISVIGALFMFSGQKKRGLKK